MRTGTHFLQFLAIAALLAAGGPLGLARAADGISLAGRLPGDSCFALFASELGQACSGFEATGFGTAVSGPAFSGLIAELRRSDQAGPLNLRSAFGFDWSDVAKVSSAGSLVVFPLKDNTVGSAWLFASPTQPAATAAAAKLPPILAIAEAYFTRQGYRKSTARRGDVAQTVFAPPANAKSKSSRVLLVGKDFYAVASSQPAADALLNVKPGQSLAAQELFKAALDDSSTADKTSPQFFLRPLQLWELIHNSNPPPATSAQNEKASTKEEPTADEQQNPVEQARRMGFDALSAVGGRFLFRAPQPCQWEIRANLIAPRPYRSAMRLLSLQPGPPMAMPAWVRGDVASAWCWRWDFPTAIKGYGNWFDEANQPGPDGEGLFEDMIDGLRDDPEGVKVDLRREVFAQLKPEVIRIRAGGSADASAVQSGWLLIAGVGDLGLVKNALARFYQGDSRVTHERLGKYDLWTVPEGASLFVEGQSTSLVTIRALAVGAGQLMFGTDLELLKAAVANSAAGTAFDKHPDWSKLHGWIQQHGSAKTALRAAMRLDQTLQSAYQSAVSDTPAEDRELMADLWRLSLFGTSEPSTELRAAAPKYDRVRAGLPPAAGLLSETAGGWKLDLGALATQPPDAK